MDSNEAKGKVNNAIQIIAEATKKAFRKPVGRPSKLTPEIRERICTIIMAGGFPEGAARMTGIPKQTYYQWLDKGASAKSPKNKYKQFRDSVEEACEFLKMALIVGIRSAGVNDPSHLKWLLERRFRSEWGSAQTMIADGKAEDASKPRMSVAETIRIAEEKVKAYYLTHNSISVESKEVKEQTTVNGNGQPST
jgi:transposase